MLPPTRGSEALKLEPLRKERLYERERVLQEQRKALAERLRKEQQRKLREKAAAARESRRKAAVLAFVFVIFAMIGSVVAGYATTAAAALEVSKLKKELTSMNKTIDDLDIQLTMKTDVQRIKQIASDELNMGYPNEYQVATVTIDKEQNKNEVVSNEKEESSVGEILRDLID